MILKRQTKVFKFVFLIAIAITLVSLAIDIYNTLHYPGTDLRNRVVGARLALAGIDPYFFKWNPSLPEIFYDPMDNPEEILSKLSVPPTVLTIHASIAGFTYLQQKIIWLIVQWTILIGILFLFYKNCTADKQNIILILGFFFANGLFLRFHVNSGQIYIIYIGLLSISWILLNQKFKYSQVASGFFAGITASLRPPYILLFPCFLIRRQYSFIVGGIAGIVCSILTSIAVTGTFIWRQYILTMMGMTGYINVEKIVSKPSEAIIARAANYSPIVEGINFRIRNSLEEHLFAESSIRGILTALDISGKKEILVVCFAIALAIFFWFGIRYRIDKININLIFLLSTVLCLVSEFFIPVFRFSYYDVQWLLPLLIIASLVDLKELLESKLIWLLAIGLIINIGYFSWFEHSLFFSAYLIASYVFITTIQLVMKDYGSIRATKLRSERAI